MFIYRRPNGVYYLSYEVAGKRKQVTTRARLKTDALKFLQTFRQRCSPTPSGTPYLKDLKTEVMRYAETNLAKWTRWLYRFVLENLIALIGDKPLALLRSNDIERYKEARLKTVSRTSTNIELRTLRATFNLAVKWNWLDKNPAKEVKLLSVEQKERLSFTDNEIERLLTHLECSPIKNIVLFGLFTGCRIGEILNVQIRDIDRNDKVLTIRNKPDFKTKTGRIRQIPINQKLYDILMNEGNIFFSPETYLFRKQDGSRYGTDYISKQFKKYLRKAGLPEKYHFHCLRHTFITNLVRAGANIRFVQQIAGHSSLCTTEEYCHIQIDDLREAVSKL